MTTPSRFFVENDMRMQDPVKLAAALRVAVGALEEYSDSTKWNTTEPMKSLGWTPAVFASEALASVERILSEGVKP
jgi:hypothetical protein